MTPTTPTSTKQAERNEVVTDATPSPNRVLHDIEADHYFLQKRKKWHRPKVYRYRVGAPGYRAGWNSYPHHRIGAYVVVGRWAYCVKWADL